MLKMLQIDNVEQINRQHPWHRDAFYFEEFALRRPSSSASAVQAGESLTASSFANSITGKLLA